MSDFTMGATLTLTDNFSSTLTAAGHNAEAFKSQITGISSAMSSSTASMAETASAANGLGSGLQNVGSIADSMGSSMTDAVSGAESMADTIQEIGSAAQESQAPIQQSTESTNRWKAAMDQFDAGTQHLKQLPGTLKQIASQKLTGLVESMKNGVTSAKDLATNLKTMAQQKVTSLVASFREFKSTIQEGRTGVVGFVNALKNIGKISVTGAVNGVKSLASNMKTFAATKVSGIVNSLSNIKNKATDGKSGVEGLKTALQKVASTSLSALHSGLSKVGSLAKSAGSAVLSGLGKGITAITKGVAAGVTAAGTAVAGATAAAVKVGSSFEAAMSSVASISGATGSDFTALETKAKQMGATTAFSATEAANAMEYMAMAGWKTTDMVSGIDGIMNLAAASGADLAQTSDIVTDGLTAFGMKASESGRFADVMAAASANANTNVEMMGETFKYVGAAAGAMGYSIEDMAVATGLMANAGIKGSQAGTALRSTITRLAKPTKEAQTAMDALGLTVTNSDGSMKSFGTIMGDMRKGMQGMTEDQKAAYAAMLGGQEAMSGLLAIANASDEDFNKLTSAIQDSSGAAQEMAAIKLDNLQGDVTILKSGLEGLGIAIYDNIKGPLRSVTQTATEMVGSLSDALTNGGFSAFVAQLGNVLGQAVTMIASYAPQVVSMGVQLIQGFLSGIQANSGAIASGAASTIAAFINGLLVLIPQVIMIGGQLILQFIQGMIPQIPQLLTAATQAINTLVQGFISGLPMILQTATQLIMSLVQGIVQNAPMLIASAVQAITTFLSGILQMLPVILQAGVQLILGLAQGIISNIPLILQSAVLLIQQFVTGLTQMLPTIIQGGIQLVISLIQGIISNLGTIAQAGVQIIVSLVTGLIQAIPMIIAAIPQLISAIIDTIFNTDWIAVGGEIIDGIKDGFMSGFTSLVDSVRGNGQKDSVLEGLHLLQATSAEPNPVKFKLVGTELNIDADMFDIPVSVYPICKGDQFLAYPLVGSEHQRWGIVTKITGSGRTGTMTGSNSCKVDGVAVTYGSGVTSITDTGTVVMATERESLDAAWTRILDKAENPDTGGNVHDYERWVVDGFYKDYGVKVGKVLVDMCWNKDNGHDGRGTVRVVVVDDTYGPLDTSIVNDIKEYLDPKAYEGYGYGKAPGGAVVTVITGTPYEINISAHVEYEKNVDRAEVLQQFTELVTEYVKSRVFNRNDDTKELSPIVYKKIAAILGTLSGVANYDDLTVNGGTADITIEPYEIPTVKKVSLT